jgi:outer membrane protein OmpA-like peptidoglycan-associated protein
VDELRASCPSRAVRWRAVTGIRATGLLCLVLAAGGCGKKAPETPSANAPEARGAGEATNKEIVAALRQRSYDASETVPGVVVNLPDVYLFAFGSSTIEAEGKTKLKELASYLSRPELETRRVSIEGHTDSVGTDVFNQNLSERRAEAVRQELLSGGVGVGRLVARGFGESRPVVSNTTAAGADDPTARARNRRVEIVIENRR